MHVWRGCDEVRADLPATSVTIGVFDGVHRGHRELISRVVADREKGLLPVAVTFDPHPMAVIRPALAPVPLTSLEYRLELFAHAGIGGVLVVPFTRELASETAERFAVRVVAETLQARHVVVGGNFRFGHRAAGDARLLAELGRELGFAVTVVDLTPVPTSESPGPAGTDPILSSTAIRRMIAAGDVCAAARALGRPHRVTGPVVRGDRRGRQLGYPTANIAASAMAVPADGVYAARMRASGQAWRPAAVSIGTNPTFGGDSRRIEAFVIDAPEGFDIYGQVADLEFVSRLRPMARFDSVQELRDQMALDVESARKALGA